jgi:hypothetical protein
MMMRNCIESLWRISQAKRTVSGDRFILSDNQWET